MTKTRSGRHRRGTPARLAGGSGDGDALGRPRIRGRQGRMGRHHPRHVDRPGGAPDRAHPGDAGRSGPASQSGCRAYLVGVERGTLRLTLGFPSAKPGAKLQSIYVHFEGYQVTAKSEALVAELKSRVPGATYMRRPVRRRTPSPKIRPRSTNLPGGTYAARLVPGDGLWLDASPSASTDTRSELDAVARREVPPRLGAEEGRVRELGVELVGQVLDREASGVVLERPRSNRTHAARRVVWTVNDGSSSPTAGAGSPGRG